MIDATVKKMQTAAVTVEARPSRPSVKLVPLTVPITARKTRGIAKKPIFHIFPPVKGTLSSIEMCIIRRQI